MSTKNDWEPCPRCESTNVKKRGMFFFLLVAFLLFGVSIWLMIIPPIGIAGIGLSILIAVTAPAQAKKLKCENCGHDWKPSTEE